jgi:uncharacterized small protein (DUF1192 family)
MTEKLEPTDRSERGPFDSSEVGLLTPYLDFGSLRIRPRQDLSIRAEVEEVSRRIVALTLELEGMKLQLQAFAASKSTGLWSDALASLEAAVIAQGGRAEVVHGALGPELRVSAAVRMGQQTELRQSRFVGVDGPRWLLRGVLIGEQLYSETQYLKLIELFRETVVHRGETPFPPNELLPLSLPQSHEPGAVA